MKFLFFKYFRPGLGPVMNPATAAAVVAHRHQVQTL